MGKYGKSKMGRLLTDRDLRSAFYGASIAFILSPFSVFLGFELTDFLSRAKLSIEYVELKCSKDLSGAIHLQDRYRGLTEYELFQYQDNYRVVDLTRLTDLQEHNTIDWTKKIKLELGRFNEFLSERKGQFNTEIESLGSLSSSQVKTVAFTSLSQFDFSLPKDSIISLVARKKAKDIGRIDSLINLNNSNVERLDELTDVVRLKVTILNSGSTDGLIRNVGTLDTESSRYSIQRIKAPKSSASLFAIPTYNVNGSDFSSGSVGKIERNTMTEFWFELEPNIEPDLCSQKQTVTIELYDQNENRIREKYIP